MKPQNITPFIAAYMALVALMPVTAMAQTDTLRVPKDTVYFDVFRAEYFTLKVEENWWLGQIDIFLGNKKLMTSPAWNWGPWFEGFCQKPPPCFYKDITGDGIGEVIIWYPSGGNDGRGSSFIYTLNSAESSAVMIGTFDGIEKGYDRICAEDLDGDSIPEVISYNRVWECWNIPCAGSFAPTLIWKWTGGEYRLANFKLDDYLINNRYYRVTDDTKKAVDWWVKEAYKNPGYGQPYPPDVWMPVLEYIYAGRFREADSVFNALWPAELSEKEECYMELWQHVHSDPMWPELMKSDW
jgi:hypothetical protein